MQLPTPLDQWMKSKSVESYRCDMMDDRKSQIYEIHTDSKMAKAKDSIIKIFYLGKIVGKGDKEEMEKKSVAAEKEYSNMVALSGVSEVVQVFDCKRYMLGEGHYFAIWMEHAGETLSRYLANKSKNLTILQIIDWMKKLVKGLMEIQEKHVAICDINPSNLTIKAAGIKIIDLGTVIRSTHTTTFHCEGQVLGYTPAYAPPEVLMSGKVVKDKMDVYCFGKTFLQILHEIGDSTMEEILKFYTEKKDPGFLVFKSKYDSFIANYLNKAMPKDTSKDKVYSRALNDILRACLSYAPEARPEFMKLKVALEKLANPLKAEPLVSPAAAAKPAVSFTELHFFNPASRKLFLLSQDLLNEVTYNITASPLAKSYPISFAEKMSLMGSITTAKNQVFVFGGLSEDSEQALSSIYEISLSTKTAGKLGEIMRQGRIYPTLVTETDFVYIIGGETSILTFTRDCEQFNASGKSVSAFPPLSEAKSRLSACTFQGTFIYAFGGDLDDFFERDGARLLHDYSKKVERIDLRQKKEWEVIRYDDRDTEWGGAGYAAAVEVQDQILIIGGYIWNKKKKTYEMEVNHISFNPAKAAFSSIGGVEPIQTEFLMNGAYRMANGQMIFGSSFPNDGKSMFLGLNPSTSTWKFFQAY